MACFWSSTAVPLFLFCFTAFSCLRSASSASSSSSSTSTICRKESAFFLYGLQSQCPRSISPNLYIKVDGNFIEREILSGKRKGYTSLLFYASWCPFSHGMHPIFETLSSLFPQIEHLALEQSSALPSLFSRYGIHSLPAILLVNQTLRVRYRGPKTLLSLVQFYEKTTGFQPVQHLAKDQQISLRVHEESIVRPLNNFSLRDISSREPYLMFSMLFLFLRLLLYLYPEVVYRFKSFWVFYIPRLNMGIFGETSQILGRVLHLIDVRRIWIRLRLCKNRNFHEGAKNARVWASMASVSLGESSSARWSS